MAQQQYEDWVDWRLKHGSMCSLCPLNGQRKVGCIGDPDAGPVVILEAPGAEEESYNEAHQKYGVPIVGRSGWALRHKLLGPTGLVEIEQKEGQWPRVTKWNCFVMNTIMCRPPDNKINSPEGKKARVCCSDSAKALLAHLLERKQQRVLVPAGGTGLELVMGQATIGPYRGRVLSFNSSLLTPTSLEDKLKQLKIKPPEEALTYIKIIGAMVKQCQKALDPVQVEKWQALEAKRNAATVAREARETAKARKALEKKMLTSAKPYLQVLSTLLTKQRARWNRVKSA